MSTYRQCSVCKKWHLPDQLAATSVSGTNHICWACFDDSNTDIAGLPISTASLKTDIIDNDAMHEQFGTDFNMLPLVDRPTDPSSAIGAK